MEFPFDAMPGSAYLRELAGDIIPGRFREFQVKMNVPCLDPVACSFLSLLAGIKQPKRMIDIGCGVGASTVSMHMGCPNATIEALDANLDRYNICRELLKDKAGISVYHCLALPFLKKCTSKYDLAFVDTIKKEYAGIWSVLKTCLAPGAVVIFDDVLLHGYTCEEEATTPMRYRDGRKELRDFLEEIHADNTIEKQVVPVGGGMLVVSIKGMQNE